jgi:polyhydroxybutyrate depolymerase
VVRFRTDSRSGRNARRLLCGALIAAVLGGALGAGMPGSDSRADETTSVSTATTSVPAPIIYRPASLGTVGQGSVGRVPLVIALHGAQGSPSAMQGLTHLEQVADEHGFVVAFLGSSDPVHAWAPPSDLDYVSSMIDQIIASENIDPNRVYVTGFSAGGYETWLTACELSAKVAAVAIVSGAMNGTLYHACTPARPIPQLLMVGDSDGILWTGIETCASRPQTPCLPSAAETTARWRQIDNCPAAQPSLIQQVSAVEQETWSACTDGSVVAEYIVHGAGHVWPPIGTGAPSDYSASEAVWAFFSNLRAAPLTIGRDATAGPIVVKRSGKKRTVTATISLKEPATVTETFGTTHSLIASKVVLAKAGRLLASLSLPTATKGGTYAVSVAVVDSYGRKLTVTHPVRVPSLPKPPPKKKRHPKPNTH